MSPPVQAFYGTFVHSKSRSELEYSPKTCAIVDGCGKIAEIKNGFDGPDAAQAWAKQKSGVDSAATTTTVEFYPAPEGTFFFPGFIDTHCHASQYPNIGIFGKSTLLDWLATYTFPLESSLTSLAKAKRVYTSCVRKTLSHGTTTIAYYATIDVAATNLLADICLSLGQRAFVGRVCMDREGICPDYYRDESAATGLERTKETIQHIKSIDPDYDIVSPILTPRFAPSCTSESMLGLGQLAQQTGLPIQTHISENEGEIQLVADLFPTSGSYAKAYEDHGLLTDKTILAHAVHLTEGEARLIAQHGSKVSHCPCSNSSLTSGAARVRWLWDKGIDVGLGTDMSGGYSPSILESARQALLVSRHVATGFPDGDAKEASKLTFEEVLYLGTRGGAKVVSLEDKVGGFEVGKDFDAQLIGFSQIGDDGEIEQHGEDDGGDVQLFGWEKLDEIMAKWVFNGDDRNTKKVWVKGRLVHGTVSEGYMPKTEL